jgi:hypothetical protein
MAAAGAASAHAEPLPPPPSFASLPASLALHVFAALPADARARAGAVCRAWRDATAERSLWAALDLSASSGVSVDATDAVLLAAAAKAGGKLRLLDVTGCSRVSHEALLTVAAANAGALRELRASGRCPSTDASSPPGLDACAALLRAAPRLRALVLDACAYSADEARAALRNEAPFGPLRLRSLAVRGVYADESVVCALAADVAAHASLRALELVAALHAPAALDAVVDAALDARLSSLTLCYCRLSFASAAALARLLSGDGARGGALTELTIRGEHNPLLDEAGAALLCGALRANTSLTALTLRGVRLWSRPAAAAALCAALTGHASLRRLDVGWNDAEGSAREAGAALGALVAANAPALTQLDAADASLGDVALAPLCAALRANTRLRSLRLDGTSMSDAFAADVLLPAVRANAGLRELHVAQRSSRASEPARHAVALVAARRTGAAGAEEGGDDDVIIAAQLARLAV